MYSLPQWLAHCERLHVASIAMGLDRVTAVRRRLSLQFACPVVTVGGTNGKGSTCAFMEHAALQAGHRVGVYSSPHLLQFEERCRIDGHPVRAESLLPHFECVERARGNTPLTYFEFTTLAILSLMAESGLDLAILEVGLGGRLDAVNVINADCAVITSIDLDHTDLLGPDRESIGREKAGIMRPGQSVIVSDPNPPGCIEAHARQLGADLRALGRDFRFDAGPSSWSWQGQHSALPALPLPALRGENQLFNAAGALAALEALEERLPMTRDAVVKALAKVALPGRFQVIDGAPTCILDVAHNAHGTAALARNLAKHLRPHQKVRAVFGAMADKDIVGMLEAVDPCVSHWYFTDLPTPRAATAHALHRTWATLPHRHAGSASACTAVRQAIASALACAQESDVILIFGSFLTVGPALEQLTPGEPSGLALSATP